MTLVQGGSARLLILQRAFRLDPGTVFRDGTHCYVVMSVSKVSLQMPGQSSQWWDLEVRLATSEEEAVLDVMTE